MGKQTCRVCKVDISAEYPQYGAWDLCEQCHYIKQATTTQLLAELRERKEHEHSIYTHCWECNKWGINMPNDKTCGNCGSTDITDYYPLPKS